jgi:threonyl-tRNA synthetase
MQEVDLLIAAEVLAISVCDLFPGTLLVESKVTQGGFFYDFIIQQAIDEKALPLLEEKIRTVIKEAPPLQLLDMMRENAAQLLAHYSQSIKAEFLLCAENNIVQIVKIKNFHDYIPAKEELKIGSNIAEAGFVKILSIQPITRFVENMGEVSLIRIEGIAALNKQQLKKNYKKSEAAKQWNHLELGEEMKLFSPCLETVSQGFFWHPKGVIFRDLLLQVWKSILGEAGFQSLSTPFFMHSSLQKLRNHKLKKDFNEQPYFLEIDEVDYVPAPNKTAFHARYLSSQIIHSEELPLCFCEFSERFESLKNIDILGLYNTRLSYSDCFQIFCNENQIMNQLISSLQFFNKTFRILDFECHWHLTASRGKTSIGSAAEWEQGAAWLTKALEACGFSFLYENSNNAIQGPRIELQVVDPLDRQWVVPWLEINLLYPKQFDLKYKVKENKACPLLMINGSLFSSIERVIALLIERNRGRLPLWLSPEQIRLLPMGERHVEYAKAISTRLKHAGFRVAIDLKEEALGCKVHAAEKARVPYIIILGDIEKKEEKLTVRSCQQNKTVNSRVTLEYLLEQLKIELARTPKL